jgi:hypothetical protein
VDSVEVSGGKVEISLAATYDARDVDSISFIAPRGNVVPRGWWGDMQNGQASCYYTDGGDGLPDMLFDIEDSLCTSALYYPSASQPMNSASVRRVGRKWRYVKNTLTRRHKFQLQLNGMPPLSSGPDTDSDGRGYYDLSGLLDAVSSSDIQCAFNYWYRPSASAPLPSEPVFGKINTDHVRTPQYEVVLYNGDAPINCTVTFEPLYPYYPFDSIIVSDTISLTFPDPSMAEEAFRLVDNYTDNTTAFSRFKNTILITEYYFESPMTYEEVKRRLVRFDLDLCRPIYLPEEDDDEEEL